MNELSKATALLRADKAEEALKILENADVTAESLFMRGKALWKLGRRAEATNAYEKAAALAPDGSATQALEHARDVEAFFNPDLLNP